MRPIFDLFPMARIINLRERTDRRRGAEAELKRHGLAVDGQAIDFYTSDKFQEANGFPTVGARGSFTSHREVLRAAIEAGHDRVLVLEDDIRFLDQPSSTLDAIVTAVGETDWELLYFGYLEPKSLPSKGPLVRWRDGTLGGQFYAVREPYLSRMVAYMDACEKRAPGHPEGGPMFRDGAFTLYRRLHPELKCYLAAPNLGGQRSSRTDLHELKIWDRLPVVRDAVNAARPLIARLRGR